VFVNDQLPGGFIIVDRSTLIAEIAERSLLAPEMLEAMRSAPSCKVPVVYRFGGACGAAVLQPWGPA
jgi:hypothetical protein